MFKSPKEAEEEYSWGQEWVWPMVGLLAMLSGERDFVAFRIGTNRAKKTFLVHKGQLLAYFLNKRLMKVSNGLQRLTRS